MPMKHWKTLVLCACLGWVGAVNAPKPTNLPLVTQSDAALLEKANDYYRAGRYSFAIPLYRKLEDRGAFALQSAFNLGNSYFQLGDLPKAAAAYRKASRLGEAENPAVLFNLGAVLYRLGQYGEAVAVYQRALRLEPNNSSAWLYLGEAYQRTGDWVGAQRALEKVLASVDADVAAVYQLAEIFVQQKNYSRAIQVAKEGLSRFPAENDLWFYLGDLQRLNQSSDAALASYRQGLLSNPRNVDVLYKMADVAAASKRIPMAMDYLDQALQIKPDFTDALIFLGNLAYELKWSERAQNAYLKAARQGSPEGVQGILNLTLDLQSAQLKAAAIQMLAPVMKIKVGAALDAERANVWNQLQKGP